MKKKIVFKTIGILLILCLIIFLVFLIINYNNIKNSKKKTQEFIREYNEKFQNQDISYVVVEINPKAVLEVIDNKIKNIGCLNSDCQNIFNVDINEKTLDQAIELLYNAAVNNGIDVSNGVKVSSSNNEVKSYLSNLNYVKYESINLDEVNNILKQVIDNDDIKNNTLKELNANELFEFYKKDSDYGSVYTCSVVDNNLSCYLTEEFINDLPYDISFANRFSYNEKHQKLMHTFDKFNIKYESKLEDVEGMDVFKINNVEKLEINGKYYDVGCSDFSSGNVLNYHNIILNSTLESGDYGYSYETLPLTKLNLVSVDYDKNDMVVLKNYRSEVVSIPSTPEM